MDMINQLLNAVKQAVRKVMSRLARWLHKVSGGTITPNFVTIIGLLAHIPIAWLIAMQHYPLAGVLLIVFGLFDTLDGELARLQKSDSAAGMFLDSVTDRIKEILLYCGAAYSFVGLGHPYMAVWAVAACGVSLLTSYSNAWGEVAMNKSGKSHDVNKALRTGLMGFEVRMVVFILGLLSGRLILAVIVIAIMTAITAFGRIMNVLEKTKS